MAAEQTKDVQLAWDSGEGHVPGHRVDGRASPSPSLRPRSSTSSTTSARSSHAATAPTAATRTSTPGSTTSPADVFASAGAPSRFRTEAGGRCDWFDDDFFLYYEDTDLSWRLRAAGWQIRYEPKPCPPRPLGQQRRVVADLRLPHRPQPAAHAGEERDGPRVRCASARALPADHRLDALRTVRTSLRGRAPARRSADADAAEGLLSFLRLLRTMCQRRATPHEVPRSAGRPSSGWRPRAMSPSLRAAIYDGSGTARAAASGTAVMIGVVCR
jgi:hypothetical protein